MTRNSLFRIQQRNDQLHAQNNLVAEKFLLSCLVSRKVNLISEAAPEAFGYAIVVKPNFPLS